MRSRTMMPALVGWCCCGLLILTVGLPTTAQETTVPPGGPDSFSTTLATSEVTTVATSEQTTIATSKQTTVATSEQTTVAASEQTTEPVPSTTSEAPATVPSASKNETSMVGPSEETTGVRQNQIQIQVCVLYFICIETATEDPLRKRVATAAPTTTTTTAATAKLSNVSAPCSERLGTLMKRVLRGFPSRLPELWEFRRRRFLRAAVVGGLPQLGVERMQVNCNLSSAHTTWDVRLRAQLDGICNLGITGLPRMYLRFTGPVVARARFGAPLSDESKPTLEELEIMTADVQEIHYQSVLGFEQPFVERASKYLLQRALREEVVGPLREAINAEIEKPSPERPSSTEEEITLP